MQVGKSFLFSAKKIFSRLLARHIHIVFKFLSKVEHYDIHQENLKSEMTKTGLQANNKSKNSWTLKTDPSKTYKELVNR